MGGYGSTRWGWHRRKLTVEECLKLDSGLLVKSQALRDGYSGICEWTRSQSKIGWETKLLSENNYLFTLSYCLTRSQGKEEFRVPVLVFGTTMPRGGKRYWFMCPLKGCLKPMVRKLYLPTGANYFGCRSCHGLVYSSSQDSRKPSQLVLAMGMSEGYSASEVRKIWSR